MRPVIHQPVMGALPNLLVGPAQPFLNVGVDYYAKIVPIKRRNQLLQEFSGQLQYKLEFYITKTSSFWELIGSCREDV